MNRARNEDRITEFSVCENGISDVVENKSLLGVCVRGVCGESVCGKCVYSVLA